MKVEAKFIGQDGSLGYINGRTYFLKFKLIGSVIRISDLTGIDGICLYKSLSAFLNNWEVLK